MRKLRVLHSRGMDKTHYERAVAVMNNAVCLGDKVGVRRKKSK